MRYEFERRPTQSYEFGGTKPSVSWMVSVQHPVFDSNVVGRGESADEAIAEARAQLEEMKAGTRDHLSAIEEALALVP